MSDTGGRVETLFPVIGREVDIEGSVHLAKDKNTGEHLVIVTKGGEITLDGSITSNDFVGGNLPTSQEYGYIKSKIDIGE